ncbi:MAG: hypothetical protein Q9159_001787 [Coniocarpon cinnabarinum]
MTLALQTLKRKPIGVDLLQDLPVRAVAACVLEGESPRGAYRGFENQHTHGWLEGHLKEENYGADWGDFVSFVEHMNETAIDAGVDLLVVDTGDLHNGAGLSDATSTNSATSNPIFENVKYDLLTIGNHELYVTDIAYETSNQFAKVYGDRYLTSNVQIQNPSGEFEYIGQQYRYFTTRMGLRIMSFGFLYDFTGNSNASRVITANESVSQDWFKNAVNFDKPIDLFLVLGHNPPRPTVGGSTFGTIYDAIRSMRADVPIQVFGGHTHQRDFYAYDEMATGPESGRYCETLGWLSISGIPAYKNISAKGLPHPTQPAIPIVKSPSTSTSTPTQTSGSEFSTSIVSPTASVDAKANSTLVYSRRYLDWNRLTFEYHSNTSSVNGTSYYHRRSLGKRGQHQQRRQTTDDTFNTPKGTAVTNTVYNDRQSLNLTALYGCVPQSWCQSCAPFLSSGNIYSLLTTALQQTVVKRSRADTPRIIILNTGSVRFDLFKGPFTYDDSFIVSPFHDTFQFIADVPWQYASQLLKQLDGGSIFKKRDVSPESEAQLRTSDFITANGVYIQQREACPNPPYQIVGSHPHAKRSVGALTRRGSNRTTDGYVTTDDFGTDGDDTIHSPIPYYRQPNYFQSNASFPTDGTIPGTVDVVFLDYFASAVVQFLTQDGQMDLTDTSVQQVRNRARVRLYQYMLTYVQYLEPSFSTDSYLPAYARIASGWRSDVPDCPVV